MADTFTTNLNLTKPEPGAAEDTWGISLNSDLDTLDAIFSSSGTQVNLNPNQVNFADNKKAIFGASSDLEIYHDGSNSYVKEKGNGVLNISGGNAINFLTGNDAAETGLTIATDGAVTLYHNNQPKLSTSSTGIDVTGTATMDGLTVDGVAKVLGTAANTIVIADAAETNGYQLKANTSASADFGLIFEDLAGKDLLKIQSNGDISFYDDTGTSQAFFWDASTERLGIGTTSPSRELHISRGGQNGVRLTSTVFGADFGLLSSVSGQNGFGIYDYNASTYRFNINSSGSWNWN